MSDQETDNYVRLLLFVTSIGSCLLRDILRKKLTSEQKCLDDLLKDRKEAIEQKLHSRVLTRKQYDKLYPDEDNRIDIESWDVTLLSFTLLLIFDQPLNPEMCTAIGSIRDLRNFVAHSESATVDDETYLSKEQKVKNDLRILVSQLDPNEQSDYFRRINDCSTKTFSQEGMADRLEGLCRTEDIQKQFDKLNSTTLDMEQRLISKLADIQQEIQNIRNDRDIPRICVVLGIEGGDSAENEHVFKLLLKLFTAVKSKSANICTYKELYKEADSLLDALNSMGTNVEDITTKCLVFHLRCSSLKSLLEIIKLIKTEDNFIVKTIKRICKGTVGEKSTFYLRILRSSMADLLSFLGSSSETSSPAYRDSSSLSLPSNNPSVETATTIIPGPYVDKDKDEKEEATGSSSETSSPACRDSPPLSLPSDNPSVETATTIIPGPYVDKDKDEKEEATG